MKHKKRLVVLDTHAILHRAFHALPDFSSSKGEPTGALYGLITTLLKIMTDFGPDYIVAADDLPGPTFRDAAYGGYKATRMKTDDALVAQIKRSKDVLKALGIPLLSAKGFEADDVIGTIVQKTKKQKGLEVIIASGDMDALQLVEGGRVRVFTMRKGLTDTVVYDESRVRERFSFGPEHIPDLKGIMGDPSDNIKGVPGVGEGSALKLLSVYQNIDALYKTLKKKGGIEEVVEKTGVQKRFVQLVAEHKEDAEFSRMLATIRRDAPIAFELPKKTWKESADAKAALGMLSEFEFRSLVPRIRTVLDVAAEAGAGDGKIEGGEGLFGESVKPELFERAALAAWILDSNITEPSLDDILRMGKAEKFEDALKNLEKEIEKRGLGFVYKEIELKLTPVLRRMEARGVKVDKKFLKNLSAEYSKELGVISKRVYKHAGGEFNIGSPKQLGEILFDKLQLGVKNQKKTAGGQRSTRESELIKLQDQHPIIADILAYRELSKLLSTYIDALPMLVDSEDRVHTHYVQTGAATGRLASKDPNLQNIPIKSELGRAIRHAFVASPGYTLLSFDYSQIELRLAAILSGDPALVQIFKDGRDIHTEVAARVFGKKSGLDAYEQRRRAKVINFGILYGMGVMALQQSLGTNRKEAQEFYNQYFEAFSKLSAFLDETIATAARQGYNETLFGRRRYFDGIKSPIPYVKAAAERMALNAPFQGTAADLIKLAMVRIDEFLQKESGAYMLLQVHDELLFEVEEKKLKALAPKLQEIMESALPKEKTRGVPITVEGKAGKNWGEMEKL